MAQALSILARPSFLVEVGRYLAPPEPPGADKGGPFPLHLPFPLVRRGGGTAARQGGGGQHSTSPPSSLDLEARAQLAGRPPWRAAGKGLGAGVGVGLRAWGGGGCRGFDPGRPARSRLR
jgi:hypothetical protein